jgi:hypothetical protein
MGRGYLFFTVDLFNCRKSIHGLNVPSFFLTKSIGAPQGETLGRMYPFFNNSSNYICNYFNSAYSFYKVFLTLGHLLALDQ